MKKLMLLATLALISSNAFAAAKQVAELPLSSVKRLILLDEKRVCYTATGTNSVMISCVPLTITSTSLQIRKDMASLAGIDGLIIMRDNDLNNSCLIAKIDRGMVDIKCTSLDEAH